MDKIWYRNLSKYEVIGPCGGDEKPRKARRIDKSRNTKRKRKSLNINASYEEICVDFERKNNTTLVFQLSNCLQVIKIFYD